MADAIRRHFNDANQDVALIFQEENEKEDKNSSAQEGTSSEAAASASHQTTTTDTGGAIKEVGAHRDFLSAASDYFAAMFAADDNGQPRWPEGEMAELKITVPSVTAAELAIRFLYTAEDVTQSAPSIVKLLATAHLLQFAVFMIYVPTS